MTIGILGGGQLGYMLALAGYPLGLHFRFLDPSPQAPVGRIAHRVTAEYSDHDALLPSRKRMQSSGPLPDWALAEKWSPRVVTWKTTYRAVGPMSL